VFLDFKLPIHPPSSRYPRSYTGTGADDQVGNVSVDVCGCRWHRGSDGVGLELRFPMAAAREVGRRVTGER
jgi:hypothetical protein